MTEKLLKRHFLKLGRDPLNWVREAGELRRASEILYKEVEADYNELKTGAWTGKHYIFAQYQMLTGYALQNLLKAIYITRHPNKSVAEIDRITHKTHDLKALANKLRITVSREELDLLERLTEYVASAGQFPIPRKFEFINSEESNKSSIVIKARFNPDTDDTVFKGLYEKLYVVLSEETVAIKEIESNAEIKTNN